MRNSVSVVVGLFGYARLTAPATVAARKLSYARIIGRQKPWGKIGLATADKVQVDHTLEAEPLGDMQRSV